MKISKLTIASMVFCLIAMGGYYGYEFLNNMMEDKTYPVIEIEESELVLSIEDGQEALLTGVTAYDEKDGDVTDSIVVENVSRFVNGRKTVIYAAFDSDNHVSKASREISYTDYTAPKFSCEDGYRFATGVKSVIDTMHAEDCIDGDLTGVIKVSPGFYVDTNTPGTYAFQYQVMNSSGDVEYLPVTVEIYDPADSDVLNIELTQYVVYTGVGESVNAKAYLAEGYESASADTSKVDYSQPGTYEITYSKQSGDRKGTNRLAVVVR